MDEVGSTYWVALGGYQESARVAGARARRLAAALPRRPGAALRLDVRAPMPGRVVSVRVAVGAAVERGDLVLTLEAMKMENELPRVPGAAASRPCRWRGRHGRARRAATGNRAH